LTVIFIIMVALNSFLAEGCQFFPPVVIFLIVLTLAVVGILLYRYLCQNKGNYRTTGEPVPGEDMEQAAVDAAEPLDKKEYFI
uniref:Si:ch211-210c8.7 n=1 Tax=Scleropages formosus TaxID=113540 RepID=A0A8C9SCF5_SCLFO